MNSFFFHEPKQHGTPDFPFEYYYVDKSHPRYNMPFHWHKEWEIIYVLEGTFTAHIDKETYTIQKGDAVLIRDGMLHGGTPVDCIYECFLFDLHGLFHNHDMIKKHIRPIYRQNLIPPVFFRTQHPFALNQLIGHLSSVCHESLTNEIPLELFVVGILSEFFAILLTRNLCTPHQSSSMGNARKIDLIKSVFEYIEHHYSSAITLDDLSEVANMHPNYFCRFFRSITHQSPIEYVNMYRIEKAAQMLHSTELPVTEICMECGFNECSNFIKKFKRYKGITPKQYRNS